MTLDNYVEEFKTAIGYEPTPEYDAIVGHFIVSIQKCLTTKEKEMVLELEAKYKDDKDLLTTIAMMTEHYQSYK
jgi:hypothetical protein